MYYYVHPQNGDTPDMLILIKCFRYLMFSDTHGRMI